jgi:hypothetical protein
MSAGLFNFNDEAFRVFCLWGMAMRPAGSAWFALPTLLLKVLVLKQAFLRLLFLLRAWQLQEPFWQAFFSQRLLVLVQPFLQVLLALPLLSWRLV